MHAEGDEPVPNFEFNAFCPTSVRSAGIIWIVFGALLLLNVLLLVLITLAAGGDVGAVICGGAGGILVGLFGAAFIFVGVQTVRGTAADTLGNGIGSIIFGLLNFSCGLGSLPVAINPPTAGAGVAFGIQAGIGFLSGAGLLIAGILALVGRGGYKTWRKALKAKREADLNRELGPMKKRSPL
jgi:hypothetical protein